MCGVYELESLRRSDVEMRIARGYHSTQRVQRRLPHVTNPADASNKCSRRNGRLFLASWRLHQLHLLRLLRSLRSFLRSLR